MGVLITHGGKTPVGFHSQRYCGRALITILLGMLRLIVHNQIEPNNNTMETVELLF